MAEMDIFVDSPPLSPFMCSVTKTEPGDVNTSPEKFEKAALFLRLGLLSTLIRHENGAFRKRF